MYQYQNEYGWALNSSELIDELIRLKKIFGDRPVVFLGKNDKGIFYEGISNIRVTTNAPDEGFQLCGEQGVVFWQQKPIELNFLGRLLKKFIYKK